ncbi:salivary protein Tsal2A [Cochliomyia hominivorax]
MMSRIFVKVNQNHFAVLIILTLFGVFFIDVECRRAIQLVEDVEDIVKRLNNINLNDVENEGPPCLLDVQHDLPWKNTPQPLYIIPDTNQFWLPNARGQLQIPRGATIELYCTKSFANATEHNNGSNSNNKNNSTRCTNTFKVAKNTKILRPRCLHDKTFMWQGEKYLFQQFICEQSARYMVEQLHEKCPTMSNDQASVAAQMYRVGFNISGSRFLETMRICYDNTVLRPLYVQHTLLPASVHFQKYIKRLNFSKAGHFKDINMNHLFTQQSQQQQAAALLEGQHEHLFDKNTLFLTRGHLAAKSDFIYGNQQRTTFNFFNVAPQWQAFNGGQWAALEDEVRKFVAKSNLTVECYTGTYGTLQLPYKRDEGNNTQYREFYLTMDNNNNGILPVPQLYYRVLIDRSSLPMRGIALIGVNNPHVTQSEINSSYIICDDIHDQVPWLRWMQNKNLKKGFLYACSVPDFMETVGYLPKSLLNVTELLV